MTDHANELRRYSRKIGHPAGDVPSVMLAAADEIERLAARLEATESEALEQARLNGMGAEREAALLAKLEAAEKDIAIKEEVIDSLATVIKRLDAQCDAAEKERDDVAQQLVQSEIGKREISEAHDALQVEVGKLKDLEVSRCVKINGYIVDNARLAEEVERLQAKITEMERQEPVAWRTFDGEGGYDYRSYEDNENYKLGWDARNPNHIGWVEPLYALPGAQTAPSVPECPYPCGWRNLLKYAIEDGAYLARSINEDDPVTENARAVTMRMVMRLRDVLMAVNNAAPEAKP